jgi:2-hydroxychromene-2-carboxylate isomerase
VKKTPVVTFSLRSPYSWIALEVARRHRPRLFDEVEMRPYWEPDPATASALAERGADLPYRSMSRAKHRYILVDARRLARSQGLSIAWPVDVDPHWEVCHSAWIAAQELGVGERLYDALCAARWGLGSDICDPKVVASAAADAGLDPAIARAFEDPTIREKGVRALYDAWYDDIFGVPYFRVGRDRFWGFDRLPLFLDALAGVAPAPVDVPPKNEAAAPDAFDTPGGCG